MRLLSGVGFSIFTVSVPVKPALPDAIWARPMRSSKAAATKPPCRQPGGPSYASVQTAHARVIPSVISRCSGDASGLLRPLIGLRSARTASAGPATAAPPRPPRKPAGGGPPLKRTGARLSLVGKGVEIVRLVGPDVE